MSLSVSIAKKTLPIAAAMLSACATVYTNEEFTNFRTVHKKVAIVPFTVNGSSDSSPDNIDHATLNAMQIEEGITVQKLLYSQYLKRWSKGEYTVKFQDVDETNILLGRASITGNNIRNYSKSKIGKTLGVDAIISGTVTREQPLGTRAAIASKLLLGISGPTNTVNVNMSIHDTERGELLWSYDHDLVGGLGSSTRGITKSLINETSRKFPYRKSSEGKN